jgi:hypothetical protein
MDFLTELFQRWLHWSFCWYQCHITVRFACLNSTVISLVIASVKTYMSSHYLYFLIPSIPTAIPSVYTNDIFLSVFTDRVSDGKIWSVNITIKYQRKISAGVSVCIHQFSGSVGSDLAFPFQNLNINRSYIYLLL